MSKARRAHLSYAELATLLRVPESTIRYWAHVRTLPIIKIGRRVFITRDVVLALLAKSGTRINDANLDETLEAHVAADVPASPAPMARAA